MGRGLFFINVVFTINHTPAGEVQSLPVTIA
jgi:hypothetical protein